MQRFRDTTGWGGEVLDELDAEVLAEIGSGDNSRFRRESDPTPREGQEYTVLNQIAGASGEYRDTHIVQHILNVFKKHDRILIVYGSYHALIQEPALRAYFEDLK